MKTTVQYGSLELPINTNNINDSLIPKKTIKITLGSSDKKALALSILNNKPALLVGETGTGKTSAIRELAYITKTPYVRVNGRFTIA